MHATRDGVQMQAVSRGLMRKMHRERLMNALSRQPMQATHRHAG
jgi:hypothetical protein